MNTSRIYYLILLLLCSSLLGYGYYLQFVEGLEPCPLCIFQRIAYIAVIIFSLFGLIHGPISKWRFLYSGLILTSSVTGAGIAGRQVWLQHLPADAVPACGPGLDFMFDVFPLAEVLKMVFTGSGECAVVDWTFLGFSIAEWSLLCFTLIAISSILHIFKKFPGHKIFEAIVNKR
jgi:protein dithiol:quinone oxidoreductase